MRICFFSDLHGNQYACRAFLEDIRGKAIDRLVFGGDVFGYYYAANEILWSLRQLPDATILLGNHDQFFLELVNGRREERELVRRYGNSYREIGKKVDKEHIAYLRTLRPSCFLEEDGLKMEFYHGGPADPLDMRIYPDTDLTDLNVEPFDYIFCGHTHHKMMRARGKCTIVNPGSAGQQRDGKGTSYIIFDTKKRIVEWYRFAFEVDSLVEEIRKNEDDEAVRRRLTEVLFRKR